MQAVRTENQSSRPKKAKTFKLRKISPIRKLTNQIATMCSAVSLCYPMIHLFVFLRNEGGAEIMLKISWGLGRLINCKLPGLFVLVEFRSR